jgi:hypothetical protein
MRIALLLSGQAREAQEVFPYIQSRIIQPLDTDVFISTWNPSSEIKKSLHVESWFLNDTMSIEGILESFAPKMFMTDQFESEGIGLIIKKAFSYERFSPMTGEMNPASVSDSGFLAVVVVHPSRRIHFPAPSVGVPSLSMYNAS